MCISFTKTKNDIEMSISNIIIFIACYSEPKNELLKTINSVVNTNHPLNKKIIFVIVDGKIKGKRNDFTTADYAKEIFKVKNPVWVCEKYEIYNGLYEDIFYILLIKNKNNGKKDSFSLLQRILTYRENHDEQFLKMYKIIFKNKFNEQNLIENCKNYILMLDTDTEIEKDSITILSRYLDENENCMAVCGETKLINANQNFITISQAFEYWITHKTLKAIESYYGEILVLSGCFTLYRKSSICNLKLIDKYIHENNDNLYKANITKLGEDRYLTNLLLIEYPEKTTYYLEKAKCYTKCPDNIRTLMSQRRRWSNSLIFCHLFLLFETPNYNFWKKTKFILIIIFELAIMFIGPILFILAYIYLIIFVILCIEKSQILIISFIISIICFFMPTIMSIILNSKKNIIRSFFFILTIPFYSILIPIYSIGRSDNFGWGISRKIVN
jgi:chitin synthase